MHARLIEDNLVTFSVQYFGRLAKSNDIPSTNLENGRRDFEYVEVVRALNALGKIGGKKEPVKTETAKSTNEKYTLPQDPNLNEAKIFQAIQAGRKIELEVEATERSLVSREEVENKAFSIARIVRDKLLAIPTRIVLDLSSMTDRQEIIELLFLEINQALEEISEESPFQ